MNYDRTNKLKEWERTIGLRSQGDKGTEVIKTAREMENHSPLNFNGKWI